MTSGNDFALRPASVTGPSLRISYGCQTVPRLHRSTWSRRRSGGYERIAVARCRATGTQQARVCLAAGRVARQNSQAELRPWKMVTGRSVKLVALRPRSHSRSGFAHLIGPSAVALLRVNLAIFRRLPMVTTVTILGPFRARPRLSSWPTFRMGVTRRRPGELRHGGHCVRAATVHDPVAAKAGRVACSSPEAQRAVTCGGACWRPSL
jgi:hypothetical protein